MENIFKTIAISALWYAIFTFVTNQPNPMLWGTVAKVLAILVGFIIVHDNLKD